MRKAARTSSTIPLAMTKRLRTANAAMPTDVVDCAVGSACEPEFECDGVVGSVKVLSTILNECICWPRPVQGLGISSWAGYVRVRRLRCGTGSPHIRGAPFREGGLCPGPAASPATVDLQALNQGSRWWADGSPNQPCLNTVIALIGLCLDRPGSRFVCECHGKSAGKAPCLQRVLPCGDPAKNGQRLRTVACRDSAPHQAARRAVSPDGRIA